MWQRQRPCDKHEPLPELQVRQLRQSHRQKCTFGCPHLDRLLRGGVPCGLLTELAGEASASKTQACLQLLLNAQLPLAQGGLNGDAIYVYTEGNAPLLRLRQIAESRGWHRGALDRVIVKQAVHTGADLLAVLQQAAALLEEGKAGVHVRLLVVDSVANVFRDVGDNPGVRQYAARSELLFKVSALLRTLADQHNLAVVVTNQVTDLFDDDAEAATKKAGHTGGLSLMTSGREVLPALGLAWANCINQRLFLARTLHPDGSGGVLRQMRVIFSPYLPQRQCYYLVEQAGIRGIVPSGLKLNLPAPSMHGQDGLSRQASDKPEQAAPAAPDSSGAPAVTSCGAPAGGAQGEGHLSLRHQRTGAAQACGDSPAARAATTLPLRGEEVVASGVFAL